MIQSIPLGDEGPKELIQSCGVSSHYSWPKDSALPRVKSHSRCRRNEKELSMLDCSRTNYLRGQAEEAGAGTALHSGEGGNECI
jgi:hypothetical protein